jgi:ferrous iron transport protein A
VKCQSVIAVSAVPIDSVSELASAPTAESALSLARLDRNMPATVVELRALGRPDDNESILRLTEIGFVPGEPVRVIAYGFPGREPLAVRIGRSTFALRAHEAALVRVALVGKPK